MQFRAIPRILSENLLNPFIGGSVCDTMWSAQCTARAAKASSISFVREQVDQVKCLQGNYKEPF